MAQFDDYGYNVDTISDGTSVDGENSFFTYVVDPNPINRGAVAHEEGQSGVFCATFPLAVRAVQSRSPGRRRDQDLRALRLQAIGNAWGEGVGADEHPDVPEWLHWKDRRFRAGSRPGFGPDAQRIDLAM